METRKRLVWVAALVAAWQFLGCSKISEPTERTAAATETVAYQTAHRKIYQHSVIPGGVYSSEELARARRIDPVVAEHYSDFAENARVTQLSQDELVYISYRKANKVYWSKKKHLVCKGEALITDGKNEARSRCGNRLSKTPKLPVAKTEPTESALNSPEYPHEKPGVQTDTPGVQTGTPPNANNLAGNGYDPGAGSTPTSGSTNSGAGPTPTTNALTGAAKDLGPPIGFYPSNAPYYAAGPLTASTPTSTGGGSPGTTPPPTTGGTTPGGGTTTGGGTTGGGPTVATPEPASLLLVVLGGSAVWLRRRRA